MRGGVWCAAAAVALLTLATAYRTPQVEGSRRVSRRLPEPSDSESRLINYEAEEAPTLRPLSSRRREDNPNRDRGRTRSKPAPEPEAVSQPPRNDRFDSRRTNSRTRSRPIESEATKEISSGRENLTRNRTRQLYRDRQRPLQSTQTSPRTFTQKIKDELETTVSLIDVTPQVSDSEVSTPRAVDTSRQSVPKTSTSPVPDNFATSRRRGRINTRVDPRALDLAVSGTTNTLTLSNKEQTTVRNSLDPRNSRKLRYRQRLSETDTNQTGEGIATANEVSKSSQNKESTTSQPETQTGTIAEETTVPQILKSSSTDPSITKATPQTNGLRRPLSRNRGAFRPVVPLTKKTSDEIGEDDNYPASFKAKLQAKNAMTQTSSPASESLIVKASQKIQNTYSSSPQTTHTGLPKNKYSRFRSKIKTEESKRQETKVENHDRDVVLEANISTEKTAGNKPEFKLKSSYRSRQINFKSSSTTARIPDHSSERTSHKYNRKFKPSTTEASKIESTSKFKRLGTNTLLKKSLARPSYDSRRNSSKGLDGSSEAPKVLEKDSISKDSNVPLIKTLPRTSYYSRFRGKKLEPSSTESSEMNTAESLETPAEKKTENTADMPLIFSLFAKSNDTVISKEVTTTSATEPEQDKKMFIIAVTSKESFESSTENEVLNKTEEVTDKIIAPTIPVTNNLQTTANSDIPEHVTQSKDQELHGSTTPPVRNIHSRKQGRRWQKPDYYDETIESTPTPKKKHVRKFSEAYTKSTEPSTNGIPPEPVKQRSRFSSKYRETYLDKPYYKPTVPTVTQSTAWLKFFVTDPQLAKSVEEPKWFEGEDIFVTTEMPRQITGPSVSHESSLELVEGEEFQLGPDMNAISFTKTRSTLSSADLKLSESPEKASHIMNVETLQHSQSVTVSIFDALAEILTSTPRTLRLSSTTEVQKPNFIDTHNINGVSNSITVNSIKNLASQDTLTTTANLNSYTKSVQNTATIPTVINNSLQVQETSTPSPTKQKEVITPVNTPTSYTPVPTTPLSARKPFAIKLLYTESPDKSTTTESTNQLSTDISEMVHRTVSDFLLTNNHLVSSELTSMLSNNIKNLIENMDEKTRSKISTDMAKLLKTLVPRALDGLSTSNDDLDIGLNTTPYSLEEIKDTENIDINTKNNESNVDKNDITLSESLQSVVTESSVNSGTMSVDTTLGITNSSSLDVNSGQLMGRSTSSGLSSQNSSSLDTTSTLTTLPTSPEVSIFGTATPSDSSATEIVNRDRDGNRLRVTTEVNTNNVPLPFIPNFDVKDFNATSDFTLTTQPNSVPNIKPGSIVQPSSAIQGLGAKSTQDSSQVSPLQLWVLNRKARVLQMIEDLIREHNSEIATAPPITETFDLPNNFQLSDRLTQILKTMSATTEVNDFSTEMTSQTPSVPSLIPNEVFTSSLLTSENERNTISSTVGVSADEILSTTANSLTDIFARLSFTGANSEDALTTTEDMDSTANTTPTVASSQQSANDLNAVQDSATTEDNIETTTESMLMDLNRNNTEPTTTPKSDLATLSTTQNSSPFANETKETLVSNKSSQNFDPNEPPKKDYVIFGILPNNTVVRKDPNDDILETLTEASPYIVYSLLPNNTVIRRFPNGTRVPRVMQKIDILPISPSSLRNPYSPIHNNPAIVKPHNPIRVSTNIATSTDISNNGSENRLTNDTVNNQQQTIPTTLNIKGSSSLGTTTKPPAEKSTASHVLSLRTSTMLPSIDEILLNSISSAVKEESVISSMMSSTREPTILTLDIDPEAKQIRTEKPSDGNGGPVFKYIPIDEVTVDTQGTNVFKLATKTPSPSIESMGTIPTVTEIITQTPQIQTRSQTDDPTTTARITAGTPLDNINSDIFTNAPPNPLTTIVLATTERIITTQPTTLAQTTETVTTTAAPMTTTTAATTTTTTTVAPTTTTTAATTTTTAATTTTTAATTTTTAATTTTTAATTTTTAAPTTTAVPTTTTTTTTAAPTTTTSTTTAAPTTTTTAASTTQFTTQNIMTATSQFQNDANVLQSLFATERNSKRLDVFSNNNQLLFDSFTTPVTTTVTNMPKRQQITTNSQQNEESKLLQTLLAVNGRPNTVAIPNLGGNIRVTTGSQPTTTRSIEDDIRQFEEDTKLLKALLAATGQNPANLNLLSLDSLGIPTRTTSPITPNTTRRTIFTTTTTLPTTESTTTTIIPSTTQNVVDELQKLREDAKLLEALFAVAGQKGNNADPIISSVTSNVRISSDPSTTLIAKKLTTPVNIRPVYTPRTTTPLTPVYTTISPAPTFQFTEQSTTDRGSSTTMQSQGRRRLPTTTIPTARRAPTSRFTVTTEIPSTSTFSDAEDLQFLKNLKTVLKNNPNTEDPEAALANRIIALAVERSLNEIESGKQANVGKTGITTFTTPVTRPPTTTVTTTTITPRTTPVTTTQANTPSLEEDIKQFQEDTKLLQELIKATGQDPSKFNIPTLPPNIQTDPNVSPKLPPKASDDLKILSNLLASPSPLNESFEPLTDRAKPTTSTSPRPFGAKIVVKDQLKSEKDDAKLLQTLIKLQGVTETTTQRSKLAITGHTPDEALQKLIQRKPTSMVSEGTKAPVSVSTEFGKSNDALLAALLKEQGFGPTTASSLDEQLRLAALLNQVVVTPKARRVTTPPPPPVPSQRRPILDGLAWLWQQWRETAPARPGTRPNRIPEASASPAAASAGPGLGWLGSGPFVGNAPDATTSNRVPLEPPRVVTSAQTPGRGQLVSAAINVTRAFSQFLGAAIAGAAKTVQNVIRAGQRVTADAYSSGSG